MDAEGDHLGVVRKDARLHTQTGTTTVVNHLVYDAFGRVTSETNPAGDSLFLFTARPFDAETNQVENSPQKCFGQQSTPKNLNRWYDGRVGRWLSEDPIGLTSDDPNLYRYGSNAVSERRDPIGLQTEYLVFVNGTNIGTWREYPYPTGSFDIKVTYVEVKDPSRQTRLGQATIGYQVRYNAPRGVCRCENKETKETVHLVQALYWQGRIFAMQAHFDAEGDTTGYPFPPYTGQPGEASINDAPNYPDAWLSFGGHWVIEVCAVCTTVLNPARSEMTVVVQQVLGYVSFARYQAEPPVKDPWLEIHGQTLSLERKASVTVPAVSVGPTWSLAASLLTESTLIRGEMIWRVVSGLQG